MSLLDGCVFAATPGTAEWLAARTTGIGSSDAAAVLGVSEYSTPLGVWLEKTDLEFQKSDSVAMRMGRRLESVVRDEFEFLSGIAVVEAPCDMYRSAERPHLLATPDAICADGNLLECKTTTWKTAKLLGDEGSDYVLDEWNCQCQHQMLVTGATGCHVAVLLDGRTLKRFFVERNEAFHATMLRVYDEFWARVTSRTPPEPDWHHQHTPEIVSKMFGHDATKVIELDQEAAGLWERQRELKDQISALDKEREAIRARVKYLIGDAAVAKLPGNLLELTRTYVKESERSYTVQAHYRLGERKVKK